MRTCLSLIAVIGLIAVVAIPGAATAQSEDKALTGPEIRTMIKNMGYEPKDLNTEEGKEKYEILLVKDGLDVPIAFEVSESKRYIWLTVFFGEVAKVTEFNARAPKLLHQNFKIQPCFFYTTDKGNFMMALAVDNRNATSTILRQRIEKITADVVATYEFWKEK